MIVLGVGEGGRERGGEGARLWVGEASCGHRVEWVWWWRGRLRWEAGCKWGVLS